MAQCSPGDQIICHLKNGQIISVYEDEWDGRHIFDIVSIYDNGYLIYIPQAMVIKESFEITKWNYKGLGTKIKFIGSTVCYITDHNIMGIYSKIDGVHCDECGEFYRFAEADKITDKLTCWACRAYPYYKGTPDD
jgi:hypothetical protein